MNFKNLLIVLMVVLPTLHIIAQDSIPTPKISLDIGGALRFNYNLSTWKPGQLDRGGDFGFDVFRINVKAQKNKVKLNADYRLYSTGFGGGMLKQGWIAYEFNKKDELQLGLTQVPFGITRYNSHSWFFSMNYYVGLEDDHDMGLKYVHRGKNWEYDLAFFKNAEELTFGSYSDVSDARYAYDVSSIDLDGDGALDLRNKEVNQVNGKLAYKFGNDKLQHKIGVSAQYGGLYNLDTKKMGSQSAFAGHYELNAGRFLLKLQASNYQVDANNPTNLNDDVVGMTAYGAPYLVAAKGNTYTFGMAYSFPVKWGPISSLQLYNDFGMLSKTETNFEHSYMNVAGFLVAAGDLYTYIDFAAGKNQPWIGPVWTNALASGTVGEEWEMRFNINFGYYF